MLGCALVIPIPWMTAWMTKWFMNQIYIDNGTVHQETEPVQIEQPVYESPSPDQASQ